MLAVVTTFAVGAVPAVASVDPLQRQVDELVAAHGYPGVLVVTSRPVRSGVGDLRTGRPIPWETRIRSASNIKPMVATVVVQLAGAGLVGLDEPVETYLPGVVANGRSITIRHLLQHRSGLANYSDSMPVGAEFVATRFRHYTREQHLARAFANPPHFPPGSTDETGAVRFSYNNTGYILLGMVIESVTGRTWQHEVRERVFQPAGMTDSYFPRPFEYGLRGPHTRGYLRFVVDGEQRTADVTEFDPSQSDANGAGISTLQDIQRFHRALFGGRLLAPHLLAEMQQTVPAQPQLSGFGFGYGLGVGRLTLPCGGFAFGHGGTLEGFYTNNFTRLDSQGRVLRTVSTLTNANPTTQQAGLDPLRLVQTALCAR